MAGDQEYIDFRELYRMNFSSVFAYFYAQIGSVPEAKALTTLTFQRALEGMRGDRPPSLRRSSLFVLARDVLQEFPYFESASQSASREALAPGEPTPVWLDMQSFMSQIDPLSRELISLRFDAGLDFGEIAEIVGLSRADIGRRILVALRRLTAAMSQTT